MEKNARRFKQIFINTLIFIIRAYQYLLSPLLGPCCRFYPSCSSYSQTAIQTHGLLRGCYLSIKRILRCHPWHPGGVDFVPERNSK